jgi:hypothetical protein
MRSQNLHTTVAQARACYINARVPPGDLIHPTGAADSALSAAPLVAVTTLDQDKAANSCIAVSQARTR